MSSKLSNRLKYIRTYLNIKSAKKFADLIGMSEYRLKDLEADKIQNLKPEEALEIENTFKINGWWLLTGKNSMLIKENNSGWDNFIQSKIETFYELIAIVNPNTLDEINNDLEAYRNDIIKIDLIHVYDMNMDRLFAFIFLKEKKIIYIESGRMNFSGGGTSLKTFGVWLLNNKLMEVTYLNFIDECHYKIFVENLSEKQKFMELPLYYNKLPNFEMSSIPTLFKDWKNGYFNDKPYQSVFQRVKTKTILKNKSE